MNHSACPLGSREKEVDRRGSWCYDQRPRDCRPKMFVQNNHGVGDMTDKRNSKLHFLPRGKYKRQKSAEYQVRSPSLESSGSAKTVKRKWRKQAQAAYDRTRLSSVTEVQLPFEDMMRPNILGSLCFLLSINFLPNSLDFVFLTN